MTGQGTRVQTLMDHVTQLANSDPEAFTDVADVMLRLMLTYQRFSYDLLMCRAIHDTLEQAGFLEAVQDLKQSIAEGDVAKAESIAVALEGWARDVHEGAQVPHWLKRARYCVTEANA